MTTTQAALELEVSSEFIRGEIKSGRLRARVFRRPSGRSAYRIDPDAFRLYLAKYWPERPSSFHVEP